MRTDDNIKKACSKSRRSLHDWFFTKLSLIQERYEMIAIDFDKQ